MPTLIPFPPPGFDDLSTDEKIDYLASLWDRITTPTATIDVPEWHREVIAERLRNLDSDPDSGDHGMSSRRVFENVSRRSVSPIKHGAAATDAVHGTASNSA